MITTRTGIQNQPGALGLDWACGITASHDGDKSVPSRPGWLVR